MNENPFVLKGRGVVGGTAEGEALVFDISVQGNCAFDMETGRIVQQGHPLEGESIVGKILVMEGGRGSAGWSCRLHATVVSGVGPCAMVFPRMDSRTAAGTIVVGVPVVADLDRNPFDVIRTGDRVRVDGSKGLVEVLKRRRGGVSVVSGPQGASSRLILHPRFSGPPSLGKMAARGEWERAEVFDPGRFTSEDEVKRYLGRKEEIASEAFFGDAFFGARKRGTPEELLRFVLDFNRALASSESGPDFFRHVVERPGISVGSGFLFAEIGAVDAWKSVGPFRIEDLRAALEHFEELLNRLERSPVGRERAHAKAVEFAFDDGGCEHWIALPVSEGPLIVPPMLEDALRRWRESSERERLPVNSQNKKA